MNNFEKKNPSLAKTQSQGPIQKKNKKNPREIVTIVAVATGIVSILSIIVAANTTHHFPMPLFVLAVLSLLVAFFFGEGSQDPNATLGDSPSSSSFTHDPFERNHIPDTASSFSDNDFGIMGRDHPCSLNPTSPFHNDPHE